VPDAVDRHSRSERVAPVDQPAGQVEPRGELAFGRAQRENGGRGGLDLVALAKEVAADQDVRLGRLRVLGERGNLRGRPRGRFLEVVRDRLLELDPDRVLVGLVAGYGFVVVLDRLDEPGVLGVVGLLGLAVGVDLEGQGRGCPLPSRC
jgi:hypothetical protein